MEERGRHLRGGKKDSTRHPFAGRQADMKETSDSKARVTDRHIHKQLETHDHHSIHSSHYWIVEQATRTMRQKESTGRERRPKNGIVLAVVPGPEPLTDPPTPAGHAVGLVWETASVFPSTKFPVVVVAVLAVAAREQDPGSWQHQGHRCTGEPAVAENKKEKEKRENKMCQFKCTIAGDGNSVNKLKTKVTHDMPFILKELFVSISGSQGNYDVNSERMKSCKQWGSSRNGWSEKEERVAQ